MKTIAFYLPQFHRIPENDKWWGEGFTEWVNVKNAQPLFDGHEQPKMPFNKNYYDLTDVEVMKWQATLAKKYGIFGFCMYHYWFDGHLLLEKPVENYLKSDIDFPFCLCWPNEHWTNAWVSGENKVLIEQRYGSEKEWRDHYNYLVPFFKDSRYIRKSGKILFVIYRPELISERKEMFECWNRWAVGAVRVHMVFHLIRICKDRKIHTILCTLLLSAFTTKTPVLINRWLLQSVT